MKQKKVKLSVLLLAFGLTAQAQHTITSTGGNASTNLGSISYSIGQVVYTTHVGSNGHIAQGVQQPYEISIVLGVETHQICLNLMAYPNPTKGDLTLEIKDLELENLIFQIIDLQGKIIENRKITNTNEIINIENLLSATYFLKVMNKNIDIKIFKIIKK